MILSSKQNDIFAQEVILLKEWIWGKVTCLQLRDTVSGPQLVPPVKLEPLCTIVRDATKPLPREERRAGVLSLDAPAAQHGQRATLSLCHPRSLHPRPAILTQAAP